MEFKYIQIPVLTDDQHDRVVRAGKDKDAVRQAVKDVVPNADPFYTRWYARGKVWYMEPGAEGIAEAGEHVGFNNMANPLVDAPEPVIIRTQEPKSLGEKKSERDFFLEALAIARCDDAAVALIRQRKE